jgi:hypothetical protein
MKMCFLLIEDFDKIFFNPEIQKKQKTGLIKYQITTLFNYWVLQ